MSGTIGNSDPLLSAAEKAAKAGAATSTQSSASASSVAAGAMTSLASNFNSFLTLLTTQLKNQDPSSPMDSSQFTSEIATFAGVQQQVDANTNLGQLISLTQGAQLASDAALVGQVATFTGNQIPLQSGTAGIAFTTANAEPVAIAITDSSGNVVRTIQETSKTGNNSWTWDGKDDSGNVLSDGSYGIAVEGQDAAGNSTALPFTSTGKITGISKSANGDILLEMGTYGVDMNNVISTQSAS